MSADELPPPKKGVVSRWVSRSMLILSFVALLGCGFMWLNFDALLQENSSGLRGLSIGFGLALMAMGIIIASLAGCAFAVVGICIEAIARRRFGRLLALSLILNILAGPVPYLYSLLANQNRANPPLLRAVKSGDIQQVQSILSSHKTAPKSDAGGHLALSAAVDANRMDMIDALVTAYDRWNLNGFYCVSYDAALVLACQRNNCDLAEQLLQAGADPNVYHGNRGFAANYAVRNTNRRLLQLLLDAGARPIMEKSLPDPLSEAVAKSDPEYVKLLLSYDSDKKIKFDPEYGSRLLQMTTYPPSEAVARLLLEAGADPMVAPPNACLPLRTAVTSKRPCPGLVKLLLEYGADPNDSRFGFNLLEIAEKQQKKYPRAQEFQAIVDELRRHGAK